MPNAPETVQHYYWLAITPSSLALSMAVGAGTTSSLAFASVVSAVFSFASLYVRGEYWPLSFAFDARSP